jgi:hypothetical protein
MVGGIPGGRSTHGLCFGVLSWLIDEGHADGLDLGGLAAAFEVSYDDDEEGSPWSLVVYVDERGDRKQQQALADILLGERGGDDILLLPWVRKPRKLIEVRRGRIAIDHGPSGYNVTVEESIVLTATRPFATVEDVRCGIPGYHQPGVELVADFFMVRDEPYSWRLQGNCAYASPFAYEG